MFADIVRWFGGRAKMARRLGVSRSAVSQWAIEGIPPARAIQIEKVTNGRFKAVEMGASE